MKNFKIVLTFLFAFATFAAVAQNKTYSLKECIQLALKNKSNILSLKADVATDSLNVQQQKAKRLPQISLAYDYLYNPIIRTNVVPVGQFAQIPTDVTRAIQFGTKFQQSAGIQVLQPIFNANIKSKIAETNLMFRMKQAELNTANDELIFEVSSTFVTVLLKQQQLKEAKIDSTKTYETLKNAINKFKNGKILKTEVNKSQINHNNAVFGFKQLMTEVTKEKIYLGFLTNLLETSFDIADKDSVLSQQNLNWISEKPSEEKLSKIQEVNSRIDLAKLQMKNEKTKYYPILNATGFLGADQFSNQLAPLQQNSWFGNSFVGLSARLPILIGENPKNKKSQYQYQIKSFNSQKDDLMKLADKNRQIALQEIAILKNENQLNLTNSELIKENLTILKERLKAGLETANTINIEELEYLKSQQKLYNSESKIWNYWLVYLKNAGLLQKLY